MKITSLNVSKKEDKCVAIGEAKTFNSEEVLKIARNNGAPDVLEDCDLYEMKVADKRGSVGEIAMKSSEIKSLFYKNCKPLQGDVLTKRLEFFRKYPTMMDLITLATQNEGNPIRFLEEYFSFLTEIHEEYSVPFVMTEFNMFANIVEEYVSQGAEILLWSCSTDNFPDVFMKSLFLGMMDKYLLSSSSKDKERTASLIGSCLSRASNSRMKMFRKFITQPKYVPVLMRLFKDIHR